MIYLKMTTYTIFNFFNFKIKIKCLKKGFILRGGVCKLFFSEKFEIFSVFLYLQKIICCIYRNT